MAPVQHSHRSTTKTTNKPFKSRHASKSALKDQAKGKVEAAERRTPHQQVMSKLDRRNRAKQLRLNHHAEREDKASVFTGKNAAPRIIAVIPLCEDVQPLSVLKSLNTSIDVEEDPPQQSLEAWRVEIPRFKQRVHYLTPQRDIMQCMDACRIADFVLFVLSAHEEVDELGEQILRCVQSQGVSTVLTGVYGLENVEPVKKRMDVVKSLRSFIRHFFATQEKVHDFSSRQDCTNVMRSLCTTMPKGIRWREDRSWMLLEGCKWEGDEAVLTGVVRGKGLKADRLVQVGDWGDFQIEKITDASLGLRQQKTTANDMAIDIPDGEQILEQPTEEQDDLAELAPEEVTMEDVRTASIAPSERKAVLLDDHHYFDDDDRDAAPAPKRLPKGTSKYQAAWYLGDVSDSGSDLEDIDDDDVEMNGSLAAGPAEGHFDDVMRDPTEAGVPSEYPQSEAFLDQAPEDEVDQIEAYRKQRREEAEDDLEFPDEIELLPNVNARERLARYRGLKSLRTSHWEKDEDKPYEPEEWGRLLEVADYKSAKNRVIKEALFGGIKPGTRVNVHLRIPKARLVKLQSLPKPLSMFSLLRHEHKRTVVNMSITLTAEDISNIKSKRTLMVQCGARRLQINPLFSEEGRTPNNVNRFHRYLHPGQTAVATFIGPVTWGSVPCLFFTPEKQFIGTGTNLPPSTQRVIAKRIILTGHPYKIHKKLVTVRYMFFNHEDVKYFHALQLWTRKGRSGFIKEPLGLHGYFKATFDGKLSPLDAVAVSLYKRVYPRDSTLWRPSTDEILDQDGGAMIE